jgi:hypothetical protein
VPCQPLATLVTLWRAVHLLWRKSEGWSHHHGVATPQKRDIAVHCDAAVFDYIAKEGKRREITVAAPAVLSTLRVLATSDNGLDAQFCWQNGDGWHQLHSHDVSAYIAEHSGGHFAAEEFGPGTPLC